MMDCVISRAIKENRLAEHVTMSWKDKRATPRSNHPRKTKKIFVTAFLSTME